MRESYKLKGIEENPDGTLTFHILDHDNTEYLLCEVEAKAALHNNRFVIEGTFKDFKPANS